MTTPQLIPGACAWRGEEMARSTRWIRTLAREALDEIDAALRAAQRQRRPWHETTRESFPLQTLAATLAEIARELEDGCGLVNLRGLPVERYTPEELRQIWFGLGSHLGRPVFQNRRGELVREIRDEGRSVGERYGQIPAGTAAPAPCSRHMRARSRTARSVSIPTAVTRAASSASARRARAGSAGCAAPSPCTTR
jgi:hypothetical protein